MSFNGYSRMAFGRRGTSVSPPMPDARAPKFLGPMVVVVLAAWELCLFALVAGLVVWAAPQKAAIEAEAARATQRVIEIVNQPVTHLPRTSEATEFSPGWFHPGAIKPDFATVDVRQTQDLLYAKNSYVTSDLNPSEMFLGGELEFNAMTKYFYLDRTLPKKRLSEDEMLEVNDLYRAIARNNQAMGRWWTTVGSLVALGLLLAAAPLIVLRGFGRR